jgi:hypothetical protein
MKSSFTLLFVFLLKAATANTYYFSAVSGNDSRTAAQAKNSSTPWKTLAKLNVVIPTLLPGDSVLLKRGETFYGSIIVKKSGTSASPIVIGAYGEGNKPVITSLKAVSDWVSKGNGIYESASAITGTRVNIVLLNGVQQELGRYPNSNAPNGGFLTFESHYSTTSITDNQLTSTTNWTGADVVIRKRRWVIDRDSITSHSGTKITFKPSASYVYAPTDKFGYFIENSIKTLDKFGEWYYNRSTQKLSVYFGSNSPSSYYVQVPTVNDLIYSEKANYVVFDNLNIKGANLNTFNTRYGSYLSVTNCDLSFASTNGITAFMAANFKVEGCTINNSNTDGIDLGYAGDNATIRNNKILNTFTFAGMGTSGDGKGMAIHCNGNGTTIEYNEIRNCGFEGINFGGSNTTVKNNYIDTFCYIKDDGGAIYTYGGPGNNIATVTNRKVIGNIIMNGFGALNGAYTPYNTSAQGIYFDNGSMNITVTGNTVFNVSDMAVQLNGVKNIIISANTFYAPDYRKIGMTELLNRPLIRNNSIYNNIFFEKSREQFLFRTSGAGSNVSLFATISGNYYATPLDASTATMKTKVKAYDVNAKFKDYTTTLRYEFNPTKTAKTIALDATYTDAKSVNYSGNITLQPYSSAILIRTGAITNVPPTVGITSPVTNTAFAAPASVTINATAADANGTVKKVTFYNGATLLGTDSTSPYNFTWNNVAAGNYSLTAKATDNGSLVTTSAAVAISVSTSTVVLPNLAPTVSLISPVATTKYTGPATIAMSAAAKDADGTIYSVKFYNGSTYLKTVFTSPYTYSLTNVAPGSYTITAKATDNKGLITMSAPVTITVLQNAAPAVSISSPVANATFAARGSVTINAAATDANGTVSKVSFYNGNTLLGTDSTSPYSFTWNNVAAGSYTITAKAVDNGSATTTSSAVAISVYTPNVAPTVSITSPVTNATFAARASVTISAEAADSNGTISKVEFYNKDTLIGTITSSPYIFTWNNVGAGTYAVTAKATDNDSLATTSSAVNIIVQSSNVPPSVRFISIITNVTLGSLPSITMTAAASDADGTISKVDFYNSDTLLGSVTASPYSLSLDNVQPGIYTLIAKATDNAGAVTTSSKITITVVAPLISFRSSNNTMSNVLYNADTETNAISKTINLKVFPNPAVNKIQISVDGLKMDNQKGNLSITNLAGTVVRNMPVVFSGKTLEADVSSLSAGMYIVNIVTDNFKSTEKFLKN